MCVYILCTFPGLSIFENKTQFSHRSYLTIKNISKIFNGNIKCTVEKKTSQGPPEFDSKLYLIQIEGDKSSKIIIANSKPIILCAISLN